MQQWIKQKRRSVLSFILLWVLLLLLVVQFLGFVSMIISRKGGGNLPVSIRANSQADYSQDALDIVVPPVNDSIFQQIMNDLQGTGDPADRASTLEASLSEPVPTMTLNPQIHTATLTTPATDSLGSITPLVTVSPEGTGTMVIQSLTGTPGSNPTSTQVVPLPTEEPSIPIPADTKKPKPTQKPRPTKKP